jgi:hypothetical protein
MPTELTVSSTRWQRTASALQKGLYGSRLSRRRLVQPAEADRQRVRRDVGAGECGQGAVRNMLGAMGGFVPACSWLSVLARTG